MAVRLSTLAEIKAFSVTTLAQTNESDVLSVLRDGTFPNTDGADPLSDFGGLFKTVGLARSVRITEDFGTQNYYGIGSPTRPRIVPNNFSVTANVERIQLDTRDLNDYFASPEYWYSNQIQAEVGVDDYKLYSYFLIKSKEESEPDEIYALMPRSSQKAVTSQNVMIANTVDLTGFKTNYDELFENLRSEFERLASTGSFPPDDESSGN